MLEERDECEKICPEALEPADFPRVENGRLALPARYDLSSVDEHDRTLLDRALQPAYRYADINNAALDGYVLQDHFVSGMGIHMQNLSRILAEEMDVAKPQFLTYARSRDTGAYQLLQIGYIRPRRPDQGRYPLFHAEAARGHFHPEDWCVRITSGVFVDSEGPCGPDTKHVGPIWMMHVTVNIYSQDGVFSDFFSCANHISRTGKQYTFLGRALPSARAPSKQGASARPPRQPKDPASSPDDAQANGSHHHSENCGMMGMMH